MKGTGTAWKTLVFLAVVAFLAYGSGWLSTALAQYPPPAGAVTGASETVAAPTGGSVDLTCTVQDTAGAPVANEPCTFTILSQPGSDASIGSLSITKLTDANGVATATLYTGSTAGVIVVELEARGLSSQVSVTTGVEPGIAPPTEPTEPGPEIAPPAAPSEPEPGVAPPTEPSQPAPQLPAAGGGGIAGTSGDAGTKGALAMGAVAAAAMVAVAGAYVILTRRAAR